MPLTRMTRSGMAWTSVNGATAPRSWGTATVTERVSGGLLAYATPAQRMVASPAASPLRRRLRVAKPGILTGGSGAGWRAGPRAVA